MTTATAVEKKKLNQPPLNIHFLGDRVLRQPAKRVAKVDDQLRNTIKEMLQTMYSAEGIGLAAPQVGIHKQIIVIDIALDQPDEPPLVLINPKITKSGINFCSSEEGCLSIPGVYLEVTRPEQIEVTYKNEQGKPCKLEANGLLARAIQHEMDHLNGVMFVDRVENNLALNEELKKRGFATSAVKPVRK
ncbi:MAG: peptide deformylase [Pleurocapsa sp. SU_5_0]|nr:peptide deformylase [Pleurocapsa sp. SU_5_0]